MRGISTESIHWRDYQKELLAQFDELKADHSIHLVAPPGSGKTLLGIELARLLAGKTLILVPSLALKNQWGQWLNNLSEGGSEKAVVSFDLARPSSVTVDTYQKLFQLNSREMLQPFDTLVLDEVHHLKRSWAEAVLELKESNPQVVTISLTATPPFESDSGDWARYLDVSGPIDAEISIPALVREKVLVPHQDFVYLYSAATDLQEAYLAYEEEEESLFQDLLKDEQLQAYLLECSFIKEPLTVLGEIYESFDVYQSGLVFLWHCNYELSEEHWQLLGVSKKHGEKIGVPPLTKAHLDTLANYVAVSAPELAISQLINQKRGQEKWVTLFPSFPISRLQKNPLGKKQAITQILLREFQYDKHRLSAVILVDFIIEEAISNQNQQEFGLFSLFNYLRTVCESEMKIGAICGDWLVLPRELSQESLGLLGESYPESEGYLLFRLRQSDRQQGLQLVTTLLNDKKLHVLLGTVALLGEGWDCPAINCLILGNQGSGFVQTQQLRGRSLRSSLGKNATSIWHLGLVFNDLELARQQGLVGLDRRMEHVVGVTFEKDGLIENGLARFEFPFMLNQQEIGRFNDKMFYWSSQKETLAKQWQKALAKGQHLRQVVMTKPLEQPKNQMPKPIKNKRLSPLPLPSLTLGIGVSLIALPISLALAPGFSVGIVLSCGVLAAGLAHSQNLGYKWQGYRAKRAWQKEAKRWRIAATVVYETMIELKMLNNRSKVVVSETPTTIRCSLEGAIKKEELVFNQTLTELFQGIGMPRYLLVSNKECYPVPTLFGQNKELATVFKKNWENQVKHDWELVYTKNIDGRYVLIQQKLKQLNTQKVEVVRKNLWST